MILEIKVAKHTGAACDYSFGQCPVYRNHNTNIGLLRKVIIKPAHSSKVMYVHAHIKNAHMYMRHTRTHTHTHVHRHVLVQQVHNIDNALLSYANMQTYTHPHSLTHDYIHTYIHAYIPHFDAFSFEQLFDCLRVFVQQGFEHGIEKFS